MTNDWNLAQTTAGAPAEPGERLFLFEEALPAGARNVHHEYAPVRKHGVVLEGGGSPDDGGAATFASTIIGLEGGGYRLYYTNADHEQGSMRICVAESADGLEWERPDLGQEPSTCNRIAFGGLDGLDQGFVGQPQVWRTPEGGWRMLFWKHRDAQLRYMLATSDDGLVWTVPDAERPVLVHSGDRTAKLDFGTGLALPDDADGGDVPAHVTARARRLLTNDATFVYFNGLRERYECYSVWLTLSQPERRVEVDNAPSVHRVIQRRLSRDGIAWGRPELIIMPDERDPWDLQFYHLAVQWHRNWLIGSLGHYRVEDMQQTQDLELCFSRDGRRWDRPVRGGFIPREADAPDSMGIYPPNAWIARDDGTFLCLYSATTRRHNNTGPAGRRKHGCVMAATFPQDRLVGLAAGRVPGGFLSAPFQPNAEGFITLDANLRGWLRAELCDAWGRKVPGFHLMDAEPITGDSRAHDLRWQAHPDASAHAHHILRLRLEYCEGIVYSIGT